MQKFSVAESFSSGVDLIERRTGVVLAWGVATFLIYLVPRVAAYFILGEDSLGSLHPVQPTAGTTADATAAMNQAQASLESAGFGTWWWAAILWNLLGLAVLNSAVYRAVLEPNDSGASYLRVGKAELWQMLLIVVQYILAFVAVVFAAAFLWVAVMLGGLFPEPFRALAQILGVVVVAALFVWAFLRLGLAGPMTMSAREFRLFESWNLTKGHGWRLFWTLFLTTALVIGVQILAVVLAMLPLVAIIATLKGLMGAAGTVPLDGTIGWGWLVAALIWMLVAMIFTAGVNAMFLAPWAHIYAKLKGGEAAGH